MPVSAERAMAEDWAREEVEATVADYFEMLAKELAGQSFNKAEHNRRLQRVLRGRSRGSIEFKHQNISAVLIELGYAYVDGYKPRSNYQQLLRDVVEERLAADRVLQAAMASSVNAPAATTPDIVDWPSTIVPAPQPDPDRSRVSERRSTDRRPVHGVDYLAQEARNVSLGGAGEEFVLRLEHSRLWQEGARRLADRVEHVARTRGDGLGFDILSFEADGRERLIEVKTTRFGVMTPFFATRNEVDVSEEAGMRYHLYRVFKFEEAPRLFVLSGPIRESVLLDPMVYRARFG